MKVESGLDLLYLVLIELFLNSKFNNIIAFKTVDGSVGSCVVLDTCYI